MIQWMRSVLGLDSRQGNRSVLGHRVNADLRVAKHVQNSDNRLKLLQTLCNQYQGTPHEQKIKVVYEKTKNIHNYLVDQQKATELELFHLQNTDHFINTFALIKAAHAKAAKNPDDHPPENQTLNQPEFGNIGRKFNTPVGKAKLVPDPEPDLIIPAIAINTFTQINYVRLGPEGDISTHQIGLTSSYQDKEYFLATVATRIGLYKPDITYVGNAQVMIPEDNNNTPSYVPVINWRGSMYAINLNDFRLYPVRINRGNT